MTQDNDLIRFMEKYYEIVFTGMLNSTLDANVDIQKDFFEKTNKDKDDIKEEIKTRSAEMAKYLVKKLQEKNLLSVESPSKDEITKLIQETIDKFKGDGN